MKKLTFALACVAALCGAAKATPSTQIWIPSTDIQPYMNVHFNFDTYVKDSAEPNGVRNPNFTVLGPTVGVLPFKKVQAEVGFDLMYSGLNGGADNAQYDSYPLYLHAKVGTPEDSMFKYSPALAGGMYNAGVHAGLTDQNIWYGLAARTLPVAGRLSAGYYVGKANILVDENGDKANNGLLLSWDRTMKEISDKLWFGVDYMGGQSSLGAFSFGASWAFAPNVSVILGYDIYNNRAAAGSNTITTQVDINMF
jgi:hypothetical protein